MKNNESDFISLVRLILTPLTYWLVRGHVGTTDVFSVLIRLSAEVVYVFELWWMFISWHNYNTAGNDWTDLCIDRHPYCFWQASCISLGACVVLTHWGRVTHICVSKLTTIGSGNGLSTPGHYLNQCWHIVNWTIGNKFQWNINRNFHIFIQ